MQKKLFAVVRGNTVSCSDAIAVIQESPDAATTVFAILKKICWLVKVREMRMNGLLDSG